MANFYDELIAQLLAGGTASPMIWPGGRSPGWNLNPNPNPPTPINYGGSGYDNNPMNAYNYAAAQAAIAAAMASMRPQMPPVNYQTLPPPPMPGQYTQAPRGPIGGGGYQPPRPAPPSIGDYFPGRNRLPSGMPGGGFRQ